MEELLDVLAQAPKRDTEQVKLFEVGDEETARAQDTIINQEDGTRHCEFCGKRVSLEDESTFQETLSWVRTANRDSAVLRMYTGKVACGHCVDMRRRGMDAGQPSLDEALDMPTEANVVEELPGFQVSDAYTLGKRDGFKGVPALIPGDAGHAADYRAGYEAGQEEAAAARLDENYGFSLPANTPVVNEEGDSVV